MYAFAKMSLSTGAVPRATGGAFDTAFLSALWRGKLEIVRVPLKADSYLHTEGNIEVNLQSMSGLIIKILGKND